MIENVLLILFILLLSAKLLGGLFEYFGLDSTIGELITGMIFGVSFLDWIHPEAIEGFAIVGSVLILFIVGMRQQDIFEVYKDKKALKIGLTLLFLPLMLMFAFFYFIPPFFGVTFSFIQALIISLAFTIIDIGVPAKILISKGLINTNLGKIIVRAGIINIIAGLSLFTLITIIMDWNLNVILFKAGGVMLFVVLTFLLVHFLSRIAKFVVKLHIEEAEFSLAIILILALAYITELIGFSSVLGAFIAGVLVSRTPFAETRSFADKIRSISFGLFIPLFFVWFGLEIHLSEIIKYLALAILIFLAYGGSRFLITYLFMRKYKFNAPLLISSAMLSVDVESLVILLVSLQLGIFTNILPLTLFAPSVFFSTTLIVILVAIFGKLELKRSRK